MAATKLPRRMPLRIRHIHLPDLPPQYAPPHIAPRIRSILEDHIFKMRDKANSLRSGRFTLAGAGAGAEAEAEAEADDPFSAIVPHNDLAPKTSAKPQTLAPHTPLGLTRERHTVDSWLQVASPPPTVLSFTRRPHFLIPNTLNSDRAAMIASRVQQPLMVNFPKPPRPRPWPTWPWRPAWDPHPESGPGILSHLWEQVGLLDIGTHEPVYYGPGQIQLWPVMDLHDEIQSGSSRIRTRSDYERILENTTIAVLKREFGIECFSRSCGGIWVESLRTTDDPGSINVATRQIATIYTNVELGVTRHGVTIHVASTGHGDDNPWRRINRADEVTSIEEEVETRNLIIERTDRSKYIITKKEQVETVNHGQTLNRFYTKLSRRNCKQLVTAPFGMDNREIAVAWAYEFACQLGMESGFVDHYAGQGWHSSKVSTRFTTHPPAQPEVPCLTFADDTQGAASDLQDATASLQRMDGRVTEYTAGEKMLSWPLFSSHLRDTLKASIQGAHWDTRLHPFKHVDEIPSVDLNHIPSTVDEIRTSLEAGAAAPRPQPRPRARIFQGEPLPFKIRRVSQLPATPLPPPPEQIRREGLEWEARIKEIEGKRQAAGQAPGLPIRHILNKFEGRPLEDPKDQRRGPFFAGLPQREKYYPGEAAKGAFFLEHIPNERELRAQMRPFSPREPDSQHSQGGAANRTVSEEALQRDLAEYLEKAKRSGKLQEAWDLIEQEKKKHASG